MALPAEPKPTAPAPAPSASAPAVPVPFAVLLDDAMRWTRRYLRAIFPTMAVPIVLLGAGLSAVQVRLQPPQTIGGADPWQSLTRLYAMLAASLPFTLLLQLVYAAMTVAAVDAVAGRAVDSRRSLRFVVRPAVLGTLLLAVVLDLLALLPCGLGALYVWPLLSFTVPAIADEGLTGTTALRRSAQLARHNPRRRLLTSPIVKLLALILVVAVLSYLVSALTQLPVMLAQGAVLIRQAAGGEDVPAWVSGLLWLRVPLGCLSTVLVSVVYLYRSFVIALYFFDLRERREGRDLQRAIAEMTAAGGEPPPPLPPLPPLPPVSPLGPPPLVPGSPDAPGSRGPWPAAGESPS